MSFRGLSPSSGEERKELLRQVHQMKQSWSEDTVAAQRMIRTLTLTDRTVSKHETWPPPFEQLTRKHIKTFTKFVQINKF